jgi:hypothetical protein
MSPRIAYLALFFFISSCLTLHPPGNQETNKLDKNNFSQINGSYEIMPTVPPSVTLEDCLLFTETFDYRNLPGETDRINIEVKDENHLLITMLHGTTITKQKRVRGKLVNNGFEFRSARIKSWWLLLNAYPRKKVRVRQLSNGDLLVDAGFTTLAFLLIMPFTGADSNYDSLVYRRKS